MQAYSALAQAVPFNENAVSVVRNMEETLSKAALMGMNPADIDKHYDVLADSDAYLVIPKNKQVDTSVLEDVLSAERAEVARRLADPTGVPDALRVDAVAVRRWEGNARRIAEHGIWTNAPDDSGVVLLDPNDGTRVMYPDGTPAYVGFEELPVKAQHLRRQRMDALTQGEEF